MDFEFFIFFAPMMIGSMVWQFSAIHIEGYLSKNDEEHQPPGMGARFFLGRLFTTLPLLGRYREFRAMQGAAPIGLYGFWGGLVLTLGGLAMFVFFVGTWVFAFWPGLRGARDDAAGIPLRGDTAKCGQDCARCACKTDFLKGLENG